MSSAEKVLSALSFLTGEGVNHYPTAVMEAPLRRLLLTTLMKVLVMIKVMTKITTGMKVKIMKIKINKH